MAHSVEEYAKLLTDLLPPGQAFSRDQGTQMHQVLLGCAAEFARVELRADQLAIEANPATTNELLTDWERVAGLPDKCSGVLEDTVQGRRNALLSKLSSTGGQSPSYFIEVARALGYEITITEFKPFKAGLSQAGDPLTNGDWVYTWRVNAPSTTIIDFKAGLSAAGEPLRSWGNSALECKINQLKPAHTIALFGYGAIEIEQVFLAADRLFFVANYVLPKNLEGL